MRFAILLIPVLSWAAVTNVQVVDSSPTQIIFSYTSPDGNPCKITESSSPDDINETLFPGSSLDTRSGSIQNGRNRKFVLGTRTISVASDGLNHSRSLFYLTSYTPTIGCGASFADTTSFTQWTAYPTFGRTSRDPFLIDSNNYPMWPSMSHISRTQFVAEPFTGAPIGHLSLPADSRTIIGFQNFSTCDQGVNWTVNCPSGASTYSGTTQDILRLNIVGLMSNPSGWTAQYESINTNPDWINVQTTTSVCTGVNTSSADCTLQFALSYDGSSTGAVWNDIVIPTSPGVVNICSSSGASCVIGDLWGAQYRGYGYQQFGIGYLYTTGTSTTVNFTSMTDCATLRVNENVQVNSTVIVPSSFDCAAHPPMMVVTSAINLDISGFTGPTGYPFRYNAWMGFNPRMAVLVRKKSTTANNTISITTPQFSWQGGAAAGSTSGGFHEYCSQFLDSNGWRKCRFTSQIYAYNPTTGLVRYLGEAVATNGSVGPVVGNLCISLGNGSTYWSDANTFYTICPRSSDNKTVLWKVVLGGNAANDVENLPGAGVDITVPNTITWTDMSGDLVAAIAACTSPCDGKYDSVHFVNCSIMDFSGGRYAPLGCAYGGQDALNYFAVWDINNGLPISSGGNGSIVAGWASYASPSNSRWNVTHGIFWVAPGDNTNAINLVAFQGKLGHNDQTNSVAYQLTYTGNWWNGSSFTAGSLPNTCSPCEIQVSTLTPISTQTPSTLQTIAVNDTILFSGGGNTEAVKVTALNQHATPSITFSRNVDSGLPPLTWANGTVMTMFPSWGLTTHLDENGDVSASFWDPLLNPTGPSNNTLYVAQHPGGGHSDHYPQWLFGSPCVTGNYVSAGINADKSQFPMIPPYTFINLCDQPNFGSHYAPQYGAGYEGHASMKPTPWPLAVDTHPYIEMHGAMDSVTWLGGHTFKGTYSEIASGTLTADGLSRKWHPTWMSGSFKIFTDVSGPSCPAGIPTAFTYAVVLVAGECVGGSVSSTSPGDIIFTDPYLNPAYFSSSSVCQNNSQTWDDICFGDASSRGATVTGYPLPSSSAFPQRDKFFQLLETAGMNGKGQANTINTKVNWGNWGFYVTQPFAPGFRYGEPYWINLPKTAPPYDTVNRSTFIPFAITATQAPPSTSRMLVKFWYAEYGTNCSSRNDPCYAASSTLNESNPFLYGAELTNTSGVSCASGCTVTVPGLSGYALYYQRVYRDASSNITGTSEVDVRAVP